MRLEHKALILNKEKVGIVSYQFCVLCTPAGQNCPAIYQKVREKFDTFWTMYQESLTPVLSVSY
jgi:hypothetical protein